MSVSPECLEAHLDQYRICGRKRPSADHCRGHWSGDAERRCRKLQHSDLAGIFGVGLADGHVRVLRRIGRFMNRERFRLGRHAEIVFEGMLVWIHGLLMPENGQRKPTFLGIGSPSAAKNWKNDLAQARSLALEQTFSALCRRESMFDHSWIRFRRSSRQSNTRLMCESMQVWHETDSAEELVSSAQSDIRQARDRDNDKNIGPTLDHPPEERNFRICSCLIHRKPRSRENLDFGAASGKISQIRRNGLN